MNKSIFFLMLSCIVVGWSSAQSRSYQPLITQGMLQLSDEKFTQKLQDIFKTELQWLLNGTIMGSAESLGKKDDEYKRTLRCLLTLKWVLTDDYDALTIDQAAPVKLAKEQFENLAFYTRQQLATPQAIDAMFVFLLINDFGKIKEVAQAVQDILQLESADHDVILAALLKNYEQFKNFIPVFGRLTQQYQTKIERTQAADLNFGQFLQAENLPFNIVKALKLSPSDLHFFIIHSIFDIAGAAGAVPKRGSIVLIRPAYESIFLAKDALLWGLRRQLSALETYNLYLQNQAKRLGVNLQNDKAPMVQKLNYAILRLALMTRASSSENVKTLTTIFNTLEEGKKIVLINELNKNGITDNGILVYYGPALLLNSKNNYGEQGLAKALILLENIFTQARSSLARGMRKGTVTINVQPLALAINKKEVDLSKLNPADILLSIKRESPTEGLLSFALRPLSE